MFRKGKPYLRAIDCVSGSEAHWKTAKVLPMGAPNAFALGARVLGLEGGAEGGASSQKQMELKFPALPKFPKRCSVIEGAEAWSNMGGSVEGNSP